jgi:hypothetical protein
MSRNNEYMEPNYTGHDTLDVRWNGWKPFPLKRLTFLSGQIETMRIIQVITFDCRHVMPRRAGDVLSLPEVTGPLIATLTAHVAQSV